MYTVQLPKQMKMVILVLWVIEMRRAAKDSRLSLNNTYHGMAVRPTVESSMRMHSTVHAMRATSCNVLSWGLAATQSQGPGLRVLRLTSRWSPQNKRKWRWDAVRLFGFRWPTCWDPSQRSPRWNSMAGALEHDGFITQRKSGFARATFPWVS
jgi:hypothetical protein